MMQTIEMPEARIENARRTPAIRNVREGSEPGGSIGGEVDRFVASLLAAAEDSAAGTSYAAARRRILRQLEAHDHLSIAGIARAWPVTPQHLSHLLHELERDGLVYVEKRTAGPDRFRLTEDGAAALQATRTVQLDLITKLLQATARDDRTTADATWERLRAALDS